MSGCLADPEHEPCPIVEHRGLRVRRSAIARFAVPFVFVFLVTGCSSGGGGEGGSGATGGSMTLPATFTVGQIRSFTQNTGQPQWAAAARDKIARGKWNFNSSGGFTFNTVNVREDLYPLDGIYTTSGSTVNFTANASSSMPTGTAQTSMKGSVDFSTTPPVMRLQWDTGSVNAAVVNGTRFGSNSASGYTATLSLVVG